jgi:hypothetical protein
MTTWIVGSPAYYTDLQSAYNGAMSLGGAIGAQAVNNPAGDVVFGLNKIVTLQGGYDCNYAVNPGYLTVYGKMTIGGPSSGTGSVTVDRVIIH